MILVKDTDAKSVNAAILALNDDLDKQVKAVKNNNAGIVEGETYNINISGNSGSVKNALTITSTTGYTAPSTTVYDGSEAKTATIYTPDQAVNKTSSPTFNTVTAALNGNATSADKVNNVLTLNVDGTTTSYDGSEAKTATIYTPDQAVNKTSSPTFASIIAASLIGNASTATKLIGSPTKKYGFTYSEYNYSNIPSLDMNYYQSPGIYSFVEDMNNNTSKSLVNAPYSKVDGGWSLMVFPTGSRYCCQLFFAYLVSKIYVRSSSYTGQVSFGPWYEK